MMDRREALKAGGAAVIAGLLPYNKLTQNATTLTKDQWVSLPDIVRIGPIAPRWIMYHTVEFEQKYFQERESEQDS